MDMVIARVCPVCDGPDLLAGHNGGTDADTRGDMLIAQRERARAGLILDHQPVVWCRIVNGPLHDSRPNGPHRTRLIALGIVAQMCPRLTVDDHVPTPVEVPILPTGGPRRVGPSGGPIELCGRRR